MWVSTYYPERNRAQARGEDREQQAQTSPNAQRTPSSSLPAAQFGVMPVDPPARNQAFSNRQLAQHRQFTLVAASNAETIQSNPLNPPPGPSRAALAQRARQARERAEREAAAQAMQAQQPPNIALIPEELLPAPLDLPQIPENQQVPVNIEDNQENINQEPPGNNIEQGDVHAHPQPNEQPLPPAQLNEAAQERTAAKKNVMAPEGQQPQYAQLYLYDPHDAANFRTRNQHNAGIDPGLMRLLTGVIHESHGYAALYKQAWQRMQEQPVQTVSIVLCQQRNTDPRRYNLPTSDEIALILADNALNQQHDIVLFKHDGGFQRMSSWNPAYAYTYPFKAGNGSLACTLKQLKECSLDVEGHEPDDDEEDNGPAAINGREEVLYQKESIMPIICSAVRIQMFKPTILYLVDVWAIADQSRLLWLRNNQSSLRVELYSGLCDALLSDNLTRGEQVGRYILPSSYYGGPQQMAESYQDAMAISLPWPDLITRVFELKRRQLMEDITQKGIFGKCIAHVHTIEFQKRGLPHMHLLVWLERASHILEPGDVDELICAELPIAEGPGADPALYAVVTSSMLHGPCGPDHSDAPCWDKDKKACTKGYYPLKQWNAQTIMVADSYPLYRRRDNGQTFRKVISGVEITFDNRHVVPYNPFLSKRYTCHINVETCSGIGAIKYVFKYVYKGSDRISIELTTNAEGDAQQDQNLDEIRTHLDACWVSPYEALWQLLKFSLHQEVPNIVCLQVHLPEQQSVSFCAGQLIENVIAAAKDNSLTAFFKLNAHENQEVCRFANELVYQAIPNKFTWNKTTWKFSLQRFTQNNGVVRFSTGAIGRMYFVPPNSGERFYLRTLLTMVHGPTSFESLRTFEGQVFPTFKEASIAQGLLESDEEWARCLAEAAQYKTGRQLHCLFVVILTACHPMDPGQLWIQFCAQTCDDLRYKLSQEPWNCPHALDEYVYDFGLYLVEVLVLETGSNMQDVNMPTCQQNWDQINQEQNCLIQEQYALQDAQPEGLEDQLQQQLNNEQLAAFNQVLASVQNDLAVTFLLYGPAGTGKTLLYWTLCTTLHAQGKIVICVASSGLAALLLPGGKTSHSVFKIPIEIKEENIANQPDKPFGGITVVFGGDFRQTLPVIPKGTPEQIVAACLKESPLWAGIEKMRLTCNMCLQHGDAEMAEFATWLLGIGEGLQLPQGTTSSETAFKQSMLVESRDSLINKIYGNLDQLPQLNDEYFYNSQKISREMQIFHSADKVIYEAGVDDERLGTLSTEYLNSLNSGSIPLSDLELKEGCPVMILCNLAHSQGVCNGTCGIVTCIGSHVLELWLLTGSEAGNTVFIPRISLTPQRLSLASNFPGANFQFKLHLL
ncbi:Helitron helicase-like domain at N-terminus [Rhizoctonia solani]|uniref:ATP-dependent DNA helicase n=1 Tax=Rhizoctonia solani TaxID=456999 RepID=A0A8H7LZP4_9AGAM|nr:Helitron helicase-like domain at N-terminus [Rhizoctonia solani]